MRGWEVTSCLGSLSRSKDTVHVPREEAWTTLQMSHRPSSKAFMSCTTESWLPRKVNPGARGVGGISTCRLEPLSTRTFKDIPPPASVSSPPAARGGCLLAFLLQAMHNKQRWSGAAGACFGTLTHTQLCLEPEVSLMQKTAMVFRLGETWTLPFARMCSVSKFCCYQPVYPVIAVPGHWSLLHPNLPITAALCRPPHRSRSRCVTFCLHLALSSCLVCLLGPTPETQQPRQQQRDQISTGELRPWLGARLQDRSPRFHGWFRV